MDSNGKLLILLVTDDPDLQIEMTEILEAMSHDVLCAIDHREAVERIDAHSPHLICVDLSLPRDSGFDVCEYVRRDPARASMQILVMSDRRTPIDMAEAEEAGANAFIGKPFHRDEFAPCVESMLGHRPSTRVHLRELRPSTIPPPE